MEYLSSTEWQDVKNEHGWVLFARHLGQAQSRKCTVTRPFHSHLRACASASKILTLYRIDRMEREGASRSHRHDKSDRAFRTGETEIERQR